MIDDRLALIRGLLDEIRDQVPAGVALELEDVLQRIGELSEN